MSHFNMFAYCNSDGDDTDLSGCRNRSDNASQYLIQPWERGESADVNTNSDPGSEITWPRFSFSFFSFFKFQLLTRLSLIRIILFVIIFILIIYFYISQDLKTFIFWRQPREKSSGWKKRGGGGGRASGVTTSPGNGERCGERCIHWLVWTESTKPSSWKICLKHTRL